MAGVNKRPARSGTDWSRYTLFSVSTDVTPAVANVFESVYSVTGQGFLSHALISNVSTGGAEIRITIDGVIVHRTGTTTTTNMSGILQRSSITYNGTSMSAAFFDLGKTLLNLDSYPQTGGTSETVAIPIPLFFNSSLLIEIRQSVPNPVSYVIEGGTI